MNGKNGEVRTSSPEFDLLFLGAGTHGNNVTSITKMRLHLIY